MMAEKKSISQKEESKSPEIVFVTGNKDKLREAREMLHGFKIVGKAVPIDEIQGTEMEIAADKAKKAASISCMPVIVEDSSLGFEALSGLPGPYIDSFLRRIGNQGLVRVLEGFLDKSAVALCTVCFCRPGAEPVCFQGTARGKIVAPRGDAGFGWDPIFLAEDFSKTYAELTEQEKNRVSFRRLAFAKMNEYLLDEFRQ